MIIRAPLLSVEEHVAAVGIGQDVKDSLANDRAIFVLNDQPGPGGQVVRDRA